MHKKGKLYLIPTPLGDNGDHVLPQYVKDIIHQLDLFIVEKAKTARRYIKTTNPPKAISELTFSELNKRIDYSEWSQYLRPAENCLLYTSPSPRDRTRSRMPSSA